MKGLKHMNNRDIATLVNDIYSINQNTMYDSSAVEQVQIECADDLSNIVDFGKQITGSETFESVWNRTADAFVDKVRRSVILTTNFVKTGVDIFVDSNEWAGVTEVYRVITGDFSNSHIFDCVKPDSNANTYYTQMTGSQLAEDLFAKEMPTVKAKYFDKSFTYRKKVTIAPYQFANAFTSAENMRLFITEIERKVTEQWEYAKECLQYMAFNIAVTAGGYNRTYAGTVPDSTIYLKDYTSMQEMYKSIMGIIRKLKQYNNYASASDYVSSVADDNLVCYMRADLYDEMIATLSPLTMNSEAIRSIIEKFKPLSEFQIANGDNITVNKALITGDSTDSDTVVKMRNIEWVIMDKRYVVCGADQKKITSQYVPTEDVTNYFHNAIMKYRCNSELPLVICSNCDELSDVFEELTPDAE